MEPTIERGEIVDAPQAPAADGEPGQPADLERMEGEAVIEPAKVMRIGSMVKQLLEEVRSAPLDDASRERLAAVYKRSIVELSSALSPDLRDELQMLTLPFRDDGSPPTDAELRVAKAQLVGWLEGLFHGIQATLFAQQVAARQQLEQIRQLPGGSAQGQPGMPGMPGQPGQPGQPGMMPGQQPPGDDRSGQYL
ncbi:MAG: bacterial proteasome activator family protein [Actinomycetota bacterium]|nr:bacterial proteasome activator family protein [Actinomycetota bacterium]